MAKCGIWSCGKSNLKQLPQAQLLFTKKPLADKTDFEVWDIWLE